LEEKLGQGSGISTLPFIFELVFRNWAIAEITDKSKGIWMI
jgi:hypothetical protein